MGRGGSRTSLAHYQILRERFSSSSHLEGRIDILSDLKQVAIIPKVCEET